MKIIILDHEPYAERRARHFYMSDFKSNNIQIEFWSLWALLGYSKHLVYEHVAQDDAAFYLKSRAELTKRLRALDHQDTFVFVEFWSNQHTLYIFQLLHQLKLKWGRLEYYHNPVSNFFSSFLPAPKTGLLKKVTNIFRHSLHLDYLKFQLLLRLNRQHFDAITTSDISFLTGANRQNISKSTRTVAIDYFDVEKFNQERRKPAVLNYPYIVYADIYLCKHPDMQIAHAKPYMDVDLYYKKLNGFFAKLEAELKMPVVIAAHPKAAYQNEFGDRICIKNETANLIINSELVVQHGSLSMSFALLSQKKLIQFYDQEFVTNEVLNEFLYTMQGISQATGSSCVNIDDDLDLNLLFNKSVDTEKYENVLHRYFTKNTADPASNFEIIKSNIENLFT